LSSPESFKFRNTLHKLYWYKPIRSGDLTAIPFPQLNVGKVVARYISERSSNKHMGLEVDVYFKRLISDLVDYYWGVKGVLLTNIGILLEPDLCLNVEKILMDLSREYAIIIFWPFQVEESRRLVWDDTPKASLDFPEQTIHRLEL